MSYPNCAECGAPFQQPECPKCGHVPGIRRTWIGVDGEEFFLDYDTDGIAIGIDPHEQYDPALEGFTLFRLDAEEAIELRDTLNAALADMELQGIVVDATPATTTEYSVRDVVSREVFTNLVVGSFEDATFALYGALDEKAPLYGLRYRLEIVKRDGIGGWLPASSE